MALGHVGAEAQKRHALAREEALPQVAVLAVLRAHLASVRLAVARPVRGRELAEAALRQVRVEQIGRRSEEKPDPLVAADQARCLGVPARWRPVFERAFVRYVRSSLRFMRPGWELSPTWPKIAYSPSARLSS